MYKGAAGHARCHAGALPTHERRRGAALIFLRRFAKDKVGLVSLVIMVLFVLVAVTARWIMPCDPYARNLKAPFEAPSRTHLLGTDQFGRDLLSRTILATQVTLKITGSSIALAVLVGVPLGMIIGYAAGKTDAISMRVIDLFLIFPPILLAIIIISILGPTENGVIIALSSYTIPQLIRLTRAVTLTVREESFVEASVAIGANRWRILLRDIWPNISAPIIVQATLLLPVLVLSASSLSYLGLGVQPPVPEWGAMLNKAKDFLRIAPHLLLGPGVCLFLLVLASNLVGDSLQEIVNPRLRKRQR